MRAVVCDRCGAVLVGVAKPYAWACMNPSAEAAFEQFCLELCSSCSNDVWNFLARKPTRAAKAGECEHEWMEAASRGRTGHACVKCGAHR